MVDVSLPAEGNSPVTVRVDGRRRLTMSTTPKPKSVPPPPGPPGSPSPADEASYPRASMILNVISVYLSTAAASLLLLPLTLRKTLAQLPASSRPGTGAFTGARASMAESALRFCSTALLPPPFSSLAAYVGAVPLQAAAVRAQASARVLPRTLPRIVAVRGMFAAWASHTLRDLPFTCIEAFALSTFVLAGIEAANRPVRLDSLDAVNRANTPAETRSAKLKKNGGIVARDTVLAGAIAGIATAPLDFVRTRLLVSARPSIRRTAIATVRLARAQGPRIFLSRATGTGTRTYLLECMARPVAFLTIYTVTRAFMVSNWLTWKMRSSQVRRVQIK
jgi:hypothetical protein